MQRPFTSGSRQAPDPFDQFLEEKNFYRKHTARDSSCLFRTISEQMYGTQMHHLIVRKKCVDFMRSRRSYFQSQVDRDLDEYLDDMSKPKTYGTLVELQAAAFIFRRNVFLFEPYTLGTYFSYRAHLTEVFRVFYTPERHFDSVFTSDYIKNVAICQSICYEILYKDVFKLPDVTFAVEQMLHSNSLETASYRTENNKEGYCTRIYIEDGRTFDFDLPENTFCILENYRFCHFHNPNFPRFSEELQRDLKSTKREETEHKFLSKTVDSLLPDKYISCVRQLLLEGITPFPYKVAKALDPNMYRNIEFDSWNEARKELKLQNWYNGDSNFKLMKYEKRRYRRILQVGAKCHVKLRKSENDLYTCHIQEMSIEKGYCIVFIEQLGEKRLVPYDSLKPLPADQFKPWSLPYRLQRHIQKCNTYRYARQYNYRFKMDEQFTTHEYCLPELKSSMDYFEDDDPKQHNCVYKLKQFTHLENFRSHTMEYCTMPLTVDHSRDHLQDNKSQKNDSSRGPSRSSDIPKNDYEADGGGALENLAEQETSPDGACIYPMAGYTDEYYSYSYDPSIIQAGPQATLVPSGGAPVYYMCNATGYPQSGGMYMQAPPPPQVIATTQNPGAFYPQYYSMPSSGGSATYSVTPSIQRRGSSNTTPLTGRINLDVKKSVKANGSDLPADMATLRYFFNLGLEYYQKQNRNSESVIDNKQAIVKITPESSQETKLDENGNNVEVKSEPYSNNGKTTNSTNNNNPNYAPSKQTGNTQRRFSSRYFNNKDRQNYRLEQNNRHHQNDFGNGSKIQKSNSNHQSQQTGPNCTPNSRNGSSASTNTRPGSANPSSVSEMGMQSPMITFGATENGEMMQTPTTYHPNNQVITSYVSSYAHDFEQPPPQTSGVYMPVQVGPTPYGMYGGAPAIGTGPVAMHSTTGFSYLSGPPPTAMPLHPPPNQLAPTYYTSPGSEPTGTTILDSSLDPTQYSCVGYQPPVQFYYPPANGVAASPGQPTSATGLAPQGYWCIPPPLQNHPSPQPTSLLSTNQSVANRREIKQKQHRSSVGEQ